MLLVLDWKSEIVSARNKVCTCVTLASEDNKQCQAHKIVLEESSLKVKIVMDCHSLKEDCEIVGICFENIDSVTIKEVIQAYRRKALKVHPDKVNELDKEKATRERQEGQEGGREKCRRSKPS